MSTPKAQERPTKRYAKVSVALFVPIDCDGGKMDARDAWPAFFDLMDVAMDRGLCWERAKVTTRGGKGYELLTEEAPVEDPA